MRARKVTLAVCRGAQMQCAFRSLPVRACARDGGRGGVGRVGVRMWTGAGGHSVASFGLTVYTQAATSSSSSDRIVSVLLSLHRCNAACACARTCARAQRRFN